MRDFPSLSLVHYLNSRNPLKPLSLLVFSAFFMFLFHQTFSQMSRVIHGRFKDFAQSCKKKMCQLGTFHLMRCFRRTRYTSYFQ